MPQEPELHSYSSLKTVYYQAYKASLDKRKKKTGEMVFFKNYFNT